MIGKKAPRLRLIATLFALAATLHARQPNVVVFLVDDLGQRDLSCYGSSFYETPNLDRLAAQGARFTDAYSACPVCSPSRAALMTGKYPQRLGITDYIGAPQPEKWDRNTELLPAPYSERLELSETTLAETLKAAGYATMFAGKWHLGPEGHWPEDQGFDVNKGGTNAGGPYGGKKYFSPYGNPRLPDGPEGEHLPDRLATEVNRFIETHRDKPFFTYFSFYSVHTPLMGRPDLVEKYKEKKKRLGLSAQYAPEGDREVRLIQEHAIYAAMVEAMDLAVGKVLAKLDELALTENTIVVFTSDNGGLSTAEGSPTSNLPLRGGKGWMYEGGIREPFIVRWPGVTKPGSTPTTPVSDIDLFPTFAAAAGTSAPTSDGIDLKPILLGEKTPERPLFWHYPHYGNQGGRPSAAIRLGDWKLIEWFESGKTGLYNLAEDLSEARDLSSEQPDRVKELLGKLHAWQKEVGAKLPSKNPAFNPTQPANRKPGRKN